MSRRMAREPNPNTKETVAAVRGELSKIGLVLDLLRREQGASLSEMVQETGWLPHTTRAALTGLRKKGHVITKQSVEGTTRYAIAPVASE